MRLVLLLLFLLGQALAVGVVAALGKDAAEIEQAAAVRGKARSLRPGGNARRALRLAAAGQIDHVDLRLLVVAALGREGDQVAVATPGRIRFAALACRDPARRFAPVGWDQPEIGNLFLLLVGRLEHRIDGIQAIRADRGRADPRHQPEILMGDGLRAGCMQGTR